MDQADPHRDDLDKTGQDVYSFQYADRPGETSPVEGGSMARPAARPEDLHREAARETPQPGRPSRVLGLWVETHKGDLRCRELADRHYSRQKPGTPSFTRPGYNLVLWHEDARGGAVFVWWRPKWEDGRPGTQRKDGLRAIECTIFRNESAALSSDLIRAAVPMLLSWNRLCPCPDGLITGVDPEKTFARRGRCHDPGYCFRMAGWVDIEKSTKRASVWLRWEG